MKTFYNVLNAIICCAKEGRALITGNPGSLLVPRSDFITWLNIETYLLKRRMKMITTMTRIINRKPPTPATLAITNLVSDDKPSMV